MNRFHQVGVAVAVAMMVISRSVVVAHGQVPSLAQRAPATSTIPRSVPFNGQVVRASGDNQKAVADLATVMLTFGLYTDQTDGTPLWTEQQLVTLDKDGRYSAILGSASAEGLPADAFAAATPKWLGVTVEGENEQPRFMLLSVPYALKAGDAETIAGKPATDFVMSEKLTESVKSTLKDEGYAPKSTNNPEVTVNRIPRFTTVGGAIDDSIMVENTGKIGVNNPTISWLPYQTFRLDNAAAQGSGFTVAATSPGGHFYTLVSTGAAAATGAGYLTVYDEGVGQFRMVIAPNGNVGIGTSTPLARLDTRGDVFVGLTAVPEIATNPGNNLYVANDLGDARTSFRLDGFSNDLYLVARSGSGSQAGAGIRFLTAAAGQGETDRMIITPDGNVGIGTTAPLEVLEVVGGVFGNDAAAAAYAGIQGFAPSGVFGAGVFGKCPGSNVACYAVEGKAGPLGNNNFAGVFDGGSGVLVSGNLQVTGSKSGYVVDAMQNIDATPLEPGDVVVIVGNSAPVLGQIPVPTVKKASAANDTGVAGVVDQVLFVPDPATKAAYEAQREARLAQPSTPSARLHIDTSQNTVLDGTVHATDDASVPTGGYANVVTLGSFKIIKVDANFGAIHAGDLLTTSVHPGYAMKVTDKLAAIGAVIGKALADLETGNGTIPVLVTLK